MTTTNNGSGVHLRDKQTTSSTQNGNIKSDNMNQSLPTEEVPPSGETTKPQDSSLEQAFFFGLSIDDAVNSTDNLMELFYNACKYNHIELVKRCIDEKRLDVNEPFNNDYPLCIAR